jgi:hypothetical protein
MKSQSESLKLTINAILYLRRHARNARTVTASFASALNMVGPIEALNISSAKDPTCEPDFLEYDVVAYIYLLFPPSSSL